MDPFNFLTDFAILGVISCKICICVVIKIASSALKSCAKIKYIQIKIPGT